MNSKTKNRYIPEPLDTSDIRLAPELVELSELMAKNVHENWAKARFDEGWRPGLERDDREKTHPCLVPYEALPEIEKDYDRRTSQETLRFILSKGYRIVPPEKES